jgi:hypothetical protein
MKFWGAVTALCIFLLPFFFFAWVMVVATVNFHDLLEVSSVLCVQYQIARHRREASQAAARAIERAILRINAYRAMVHSFPGVSDLLTTEGEETTIAA